MNSRKLWTSVTFVGVGQFLIASILPSSVATPWQKSHALNRQSAIGIAHIWKAWALVQPPPISGVQPLISEGGWPDPWRRWLCPLSRWCTNGDWGAQDKSPSASEKYQGQWWVQKASFHTHRSPVALLWMQSMVSFPHLSQPASILTSGWGKRTTESLVSYQGFHWYGIASMHP